jgi:Family of unknown function (DUF5683)
MKSFFSLIILCICCSFLKAQEKDSSAATIAVEQPVADSVTKAVDTVKKIVAHNPRKATFRSAVLPGWGQAYNKKYWKIPIVWGALGTCIGFFVYNRNEYIDARDAYRLKLDTTLTEAQALALMKPKFRPVDPEGIRQYRNGVRQNVDYSVLFFLVCWGLNIVDATVDGHLKEFNVTENLSMRINPTYVPQTRQSGVSVVMRFGK